MYEQIKRAAILGDLEPDQVVRADELDRLELLLELLRAEGSVEFDRGLGAVAVERLQALDLDALQHRQFLDHGAVELQVVLLLAVATACPRGGR